MTRLFTQERFNVQVRRECWHYVDHFGRLLLIQLPANKISMYIKKINIPSSLLYADAKYFYLPDLLRTPQYRRESPSKDHVKKKTTSQLTLELHYSLQNTSRRREVLNLQHTATYTAHICNIHLPLARIISCHGNCYTLARLHSRARGVCMCDETDSRWQ
jgi:hypothetical protein